MQPICELIPSLFQPGVEQMGPQTAPVKPPRYKFHERSVILRCDSSDTATVRWSAHNAGCIRVEKQAESILLSETSMLRVISLNNLG